MPAAHHREGIDVIYEVTAYQAAWYQADRFPTAPGGTSWATRRAIY